MLCFFNLISCSFTLRLFFPTLDIKSFKDSQKIHLAKIDPLIQTSTFRCFFFLNQFIADYEILPICNSLLIYKNLEETNYKNEKQECSISIATSINAMLLSKPSGH